MASWIVIAIAVAVIAALALLIWLWWQVPKWQMQNRIFKSEKERADAEDNFRKTVGQALGGAAVLIGAGAAYLQFSQQQQAARDQLRAANDLRVSTQVAKGFEQLASDKPAMRLGRIYGLEGVMNTSPEYHQAVLEALCAFVRDGTIGMIVGEHPTTDVQSALIVIGRRKEGEGRVNLAAALIRGADLSGATLSDANLFQANLSGAFLSAATLRDADLFQANLSHADLSQANLFQANLSGAFLSHADLSGAFLSAANLFQANLSRANLSRADLDGALNLTQAQLDDACGEGTTLPQGLTLQPCW